MIDIKLPYPPSINRMYATGNGRFYKNKIAKDYTTLVGKILFSTRYKAFVATERIRFELYLYPSDKRLRDIDAGLKVLLDAFQACGIYANDCQIKQLYVEMMPKLPKDFTSYCHCFLSIIP